MAEVHAQDEASILQRVIAPDAGSLTAEVADSLLQLTFPESDLDRMNELAERNRKGEASPADIDELERYSRVGNLLNLLHSEARRSPKNGQHG